ncbi:hypothetical protein RB653_010481 [Dictyostelium firmibasis]|uniref:FZ domain-containing protein n=1 Tax=Dictyostelium firmibasis TaxID=79012 RepID=A0AAN7YVW3_9MYCE
MKLILIIFLLYVFQASYGQTLYPIDPSGKCEPYIGDTQSSPCSKFLNNLGSIYVSSNATQENAMKKLDEYFGILGALGGPECKSDSLTYKTLCAIYLPECESFTNNQTNITIAIPKRICYNTCNGVITKCKIPKLYFSCDQIEPVSGLPMFPSNYSEFNLTKYDVGNSNYTLQCLTPISDNTTIDIISTNCPHPLFYHNSTDHEADYDRGYLFVSDSSNCVIPNPVPIYTDKQWDQLYNLSNILAVLSTFGAGYLLVTFILLNPKITNFDRMYAFFNASVFMMSLSGVIIFIAGGPRSLIKDGGARIAVFEDPLCSSTGFIFQFFAISAILFWAYMGFDLWWRVKFMTKPLNIHKYYVPSAFIIAFILSVIPLATKNYRMVRGNIHCWVYKAPLQNTLFFGPLGITLTISTGFIGLVIYEIYKIVKATGRGGVLKLEIKPILNIILIYFSFVYIFAFNFHNDNNQQNTYGTIESFFQCTLESDDPSKCTIGGPSIGSLGYFIYCIRIYGVYCFLLQGLNKRAFKIWKRSIIFNNKLVLFIKVKILLMDNNNNVSEGGNSSTTAGGSTNINKNNNNNSKPITSKNTMDSYAFSKNNDSDSDSDDYDPYHKKQNLKQNDIEIGTINTNN